MKRMRRTINVRLENKRGSVLIIGYFVLVLLLGFGASFMVMSTNEAKSSKRENLMTLAFHIAESGIERGLYELRQDFVGQLSPSWADGQINTYAIGPDMVNYFTIPYNDATLNGGSYTVQLLNVSDDDIWLKSTGTINDVSHTLLTYVRMVDVSPWDTAIFAGAGASGTMINGNVDIRGSVIILGEGLADGDYAIDLGGTAELVGNNYVGLDSSLLAKVPSLPTTMFGGETISTLNAELRVKRGLVGLSGSSTVGEANITGNSVKETVNGVYVSDGWGGTSGASSAYSDNGTSNAYDLGDAVVFPSLSDPAPEDSSRTVQEYFRDHAYVLTSAEEAMLASVTPSSSFSIGSGVNTITMDGSGNMTVNGRIYVDNGGSFNLSKQGSDKTINYTGSGTLLVTGSVQINVNLITAGNNSFPNNIVGIMTPNQIGFNEANINVMGVFYAEDHVTVEKQTDIMGTIVSNYFDMGTNVPSIYQVPDTVNYLPPGMIGGSSRWYMVVSWQKI